MSVSIKYKGNEIASMKATGTKTLNTEGKYCEGNIIVENTESGGGGGGAVSPKDINFYDYDGTCVAAWSLAELAGKTALPDYPTHEGLTCQGWNWTLADLKAENAKMNVGAMYITSDGKTRIYITLQEGRTSPKLSVSVNGTVTVDWGDGTTPDRLNGTSLTAVLWTPTHSYAAPGDYVITLAVDGVASFYGQYQSSRILRYSSDWMDNRNACYLSAIRRVEVGAGMKTLGAYGFTACNSLASVSLSNGEDGWTSEDFKDCEALVSVTLPSGATSVYSSMFSGCSALSFVSIPKGVTSIGGYAFKSCAGLKSITIPSSVAEIKDSSFRACKSLASITIPSSVTSIGSNAFYDCYGMAFYDFTACTAVPTLASTDAFNHIPADCEIRVPAALVDEWKAATNWATYANQIVGV